MRMLPVAKCLFVRALSNARLYCSPRFPRRSSRGTAPCLSAHALRRSSRRPPLVSCGQRVDVACASPSRPLMTANWRSVAPCCSAGGALILAPFSMRKMRCGIRSVSACDIEGGMWRDGRRQIEMCTTSEKDTNYAEAPKHYGGLPLSSMASGLQKPADG